MNDNNNFWYGLTCGYCDRNIYNCHCHNIIEKIKIIYIFFIKILI